VGAPPRHAMPRHATPCNAMQSYSHDGHQSRGALLLLLQKNELHHTAIPSRCNFTLAVGVAPPPPPGKTKQREYEVPLFPLA
jgi:hypothetical protein